MSLLAPLFLIGLAAIALPVWLHRLQTQSPEREPFGSAMFLEPSERRVHLKKQFRFLVLLALRILLLALLAFAFAKPILQQPPQLIAGEVPTLHLIVIDTSLSMGHGDRLARAKSTARELIDDRVLRAIGRELGVAHSGAGDRGIHRQRLVHGHELLPRDRLDGPV